MPGQGQGEVAVTTVQFQQVPAQRLCCAAGPLDHPYVDRSVGLGEGLFVLAVAVVPALNPQLFGDEVAADDFFLLAAATYQRNSEVSRQGFRLQPPGLLQPPVVDQRHQGVAREGAQEFDLEQLAAQFGCVPQLCQERRHQLLDSLAGNGKVLHRHRGVRFAAAEHDVVQVVAVVPEAELGAQAKPRTRRWDHFRFGCREGCQQGLYSRGLGGEQLLIMLGIKGTQGHGCLQAVVGFRETGDLAAELGRRSGEQGQ